MASVKNSGNFVEFDEYVEYQLEKTRQGVKWTDILVALAGVAVLVLGYLLVFVVADHWLFEGGVPRTLRVAASLTVLAISVIWLIFKAFWPMWRRVNDLYAARMLEQAEPGLRGHLLGLVDSRRAGRLPSEEVRKALEKRAATTLSEIDVESAIDRRSLMRVSYVLLGIVLIACAYALFSPKRIGPSLVRAMIPGTSLDVATRTEILDVRPGDATILAGAQLDVSMQLRGERPKQVWLFYSTADRRFVNEPVEMQLVDATTREYRASLIGDSGRGLTQDLTYRIEAGDATTKPFSVDVGRPPVATIASITLTYPGYTVQPPATISLPPIEAVEGTEVKLVAEANRPLKSGKIVFADNPDFRQTAEEVPLNISEDGLTVSANWTLAIRSDGSSPSFFRIECRDRKGQSNPNPTVFPITILEDQDPEITLLDPQSDLERPANAIVPLLVAARDPDYELREITLHIAKDGEPIPGRSVLWEGSEAAVKFRHEWSLEPLGLKPGQTVTFYLQARDNREPDANRRNTPKINIHITEPVPEEQVQKQLAKDIQKQQQADAAPTPPAAPEDGEQPPREREAGETGETGEAGKEGTKQTDKAEEQGESESRDPVKNDGSEDDEVLRQLMQEQREKQQQQKQNPPSDAGKQQGAGSEQKGAKGAGKGEEKGTSGSGSQGESGQQGESTTGGGEGAGETGEAGKGQGGEASMPSDGNGATESPQGAGGGGKQAAADENAGSSESPMAPAGGAKTGEGQPSGESREKGSGAGGQDVDGKSDGSGKGEASGGAEGSQGESQGEMPSKAGNENADGQGSPSSESAPTDGQKAADGSASQENAAQESGEKTAGGGSASDGDQSPMERAAKNGESAGAQGGETQKTGTPGEQGAGERETGETGGQEASGEASGMKKGDEQTGESSSSKSEAGGENTSDENPETGVDGEGETGRQGDGETSEREPQEDQNGAAGEPNSQEQDPSGKEVNGGGMPSEGGSETGKPEAGASGSGKPGAGESGASPAGKSGAGESPAGAGQSGDGQSGKGQSGEGKSDAGQSGKGQSGKGQSGAGQSGKSASGEGQGSDGQGQSGKGQSGQGQSGEGQSGKGQSGKGSAGQGKGGKGGQAAGGSGGNPTNGTGGSGSGSGEQGMATEKPGAGDAAGDPANEEFSKETANLVLERLEEDLARGEVDPELLKQLGWTEEDMRRFADRLESNLAPPTGEETAEERARRLEFEHMLENMTFQPQAEAREGGTGRAEEVEGVGAINPAVPSEYREAYERFTRSVSGLRTGEGETGSGGE